MSKSKKPAKSSKPSHITGAGTQKYQANGPSAWAPFFKQLAERIAGKGAPVGLGIRFALAYAVDEGFAHVLASAGKDAGQHVRAVDLVPAKPAPKAKTPKAKTEVKAS